MATIARARSGDSPSSGSAAGSVSPGAEDPAKANAAAPAPSSAELTDPLKQLRDLLEAQSKQAQQQNEQLIEQIQQQGNQLREQQQKVEFLQEQLAAVQAAGGAQSGAVGVGPVAAAYHVAGTGADSSPTAGAQGSDINARLDNIEQKVGVLDKLKFSGDLRLRFEPFFGGGAVTAAEPQDRYRESYRLRFNVDTKVTDDFAAGFSLASGDLGNPVSTDSTETGFYTRKPIAVDRAFGAYNPHYFRPFTLTAGKFAYTWLRTELTWDNDLNPEGASEAFAWNWKDQFINHFAIVAFQTPIFEVGGGPDTYMAGGQIQTGWKLASPVKLTADVAYYDFQNADTIARNQGQNPDNGSATQGTTNSGGGNFGFSASSLTNNFGVINGKRVFASKYGIVDAIVRLDFNTGYKRWPVYALFDFVQNTRACENIQAFVAAGVALPTCDAHQRHGYWSELQFGRTQNKGDLLLGYTFARIERDSVLSAFDFSSLRQPTNVLEHRIEVQYKAYSHAQLGFTGLMGRQIGTAQSATPERWLKRLQIDSIFTF